MTQMIPFPGPPGRAGPGLPPLPADPVKGGGPGTDPGASPSVGRAPPVCPPTLSEAFPETPADPAGPIGFVLAALRAALPPDRPVLWVQDRLTAREAGAPYAPGLPLPVIHVRASGAGDVLMAMETGLACPALGAVIGEIWGAPKRLDFTATKRLALRAERAGLPCWLMRRGASPDLSAARQRWRVGAVPSLPDPWDDRAPGDPRWRATLFRSRLAPPGTWVATHDRAADRLDLAPADGDGAVVAPAREGAGRAAR